MRRPSGRHSSEWSTRNLPTSAHGRTANRETAFLRCPASTPNALADARPPHHTQPRSKRAYGYRQLATTVPSERVVRRIVANARDAGTDAPAAPELKAANATTRAAGRAKRLTTAFIRHGRPSHHTTACDRHSIGVPVSEPDDGATACYHQRARKGANGRRRCALM